MWKSVHVQPESLFTFRQNRCSLSIRMSVHFGAEYANNKLEEKRERKKYSPQFKDQAVERAEKDGVRQVAQDLGIPEAILYG